MSSLLHWRSLANLTLQLAILGLLIATFSIRAWPVLGLSMAPHIASGEYVLVNTFAYRFGPPHRGDIVAFRHDDGTHELFIKRVAAIPGDRVRIDRGVVYLNGTQRRRALRSLPRPAQLSRSGRAGRERLRAGRQSRR